MQGVYKVENINNGKVILDKEGMDSIIKYLDSKSMYDKLHHQVRGGIN